MAYTFKKQIFGFLDLIRFTRMVPRRRKKLAEGADTPLPASYAVNECAKILHPGYQKAVLVSVLQNTEDAKTYVFETARPFYFRAGQYVTLGCRVGESEVSRPYALTSSPRDALKRRAAVTVKKSGFFSGYLFENAKAGDVFEMGDPSGDFCYEPLRDAPHVAGIAGGGGITPFYSMAQAIADGTDDYALTIFYGAKKYEDLIFKDRLDALVSDKIKVVYVLSEEKKKGYEHGFIDAELLRKYLSGSFSVMMSGPAEMYAFAEKELAALGVAPERIRREANCVGARDVSKKAHCLTVHSGFETYALHADSRETVLTALERAGIKAPSKCRAGGCGFCHSKVLSGAFSVAGEDKRRMADEKFGYFHPCCSYPDSDMEIIVPEA